MRGQEPHLRYFLSLLKMSYYALLEFLGEGAAVGDRYEYCVWLLICKDINGVLFGASPRNVKSFLSFVVLSSDLTSDN